MVPPVLCVKCFRFLFKLACLRSQYYLKMFRYNCFMAEVYGNEKHISYICTWNVRGIHNPIKRKKILTYIRKEKIGIALLQETHFDKEEHLKLKQGGYNQVYSSSFSLGKLIIVSFPRV